MNLYTHIPTPPASSFQIGEFNIHYYGLFIMVGFILAATWSYFRAKKIDLKIADNVLNILIVLLPSAIVGARLYYVITVPKTYLSDPLAIFKIWEGGLGILGGLVGGILGVYVFCKICKIRFSNLLYIAVPVIPLAQACGRLGNWFNGELYGTKTNLPWGLDISRGKYQATVFYHPTFLYEIIWDLLIFVILILIFSVHNFTRIKAYLSLPVYLALYTFGRFWIEQIRTDTSEYWLGLRLNSWFILAIFVVSVSGIMFIWLKKSILVKKK